MVAYAKASPRVQRVDTTTNAALLTPERSRAILDAGLDRLNVSVEGMTAQQYREFSHAELDFGRFVENIAWFYDHRGGCELNVKINGDNLTSEQEQAFFATFGDICDGISVERTIDYWPKYNAMRVDYDESVTLLGGKSREVQVCPYVFYEMCVNSDGTFSLCRFDWNHAMLLDRHVGAPPTLQKDLGQHRAVELSAALSLRGAAAADGALVPQVRPSKTGRARGSGRLRRRDIGSDVIRPCISRPPGL